MEGSDNKINKYGKIIGGGDFVKFRKPLLFFVLVLTLVSTLSMISIASNNDKVTYGDSKKDIGIKTVECEPQEDWWTAYTFCTSDHLCDSSNPPGGECKTEWAMQKREVICCQVEDPTVCDDPYYERRTIHIGCCTWACFYK